MVASIDTGKKIMQSLLDISKKLDIGSASMKVSYHHRKVSSHVNTLQIYFLRVMKSSLRFWTFCRYGVTPSRAPYDIAIL